MVVHHLEAVEGITRGNGGSSLRLVQHGRVLVLEGLVLRHELRFDQQEGVVIAQAARCEVVVQADELARELVQEQRSGPSKINRVQTTRG